MRILIADDHELVRSGVRALLLSRLGFDVCGEATDGQEAVEKAAQLKPDAIVMDISMPRLSGLAATREIRRTLPNVKVIILSQDDTGEMMRHARKAGAVGYVVKSSISDDLLAALSLIRPAEEAALQGQGNGHALSAAGNRVADHIERATSAIGEFFEHGYSGLVVPGAEVLFREILDSLPAAVYATDLEGRLTYCNPAAIEFAGRTPEIGTDRWCVSWKLYRPDGSPLPLDECPMAVAIKEGRILKGVEAIVERPDGMRRWFSPYPRLLRDADGNVIGGINLLLDITERKRNELSTNLLAAIVDSTEDAIISKNLDGIITSWNPAAEHIFGYTAAEVIGRHITVIVPPDRVQEEMSILSRLRRNERIQHFETVRMRKDHRPLHVSLTISPIKDGDGHLIGASKVARDITERKLSEEALLRSEARLLALSEKLDSEVNERTRELQIRNAEVQKQADQLRDLSWRLLRAQDEQRRQIARELHDSAGQILTVIGMNLGSLVQEAQRSSPTLAAAAEEIQQLVQQLHQEIRTTSYLLHPPLLDEIGLPAAIRWYTEGLAERSDLEIEFQVPDNFDRLPRHLELVIYRLVQECLTNVYRHSGSKSAAIRLEHEGQIVRIEVRDRGKGIPPDRLTEVLSRGAGVGIQGMRERLREFQGDVTIESSSSGTAIIAAIPVARAATSSEAEIDSVPNVVIEPQAASSPQAATAFQQAD